MNLSLVDQYWAFGEIEGFEPERVGRNLKQLLSDPGLGAGWIAEAEGAAVGYLLAVYYVFSLEHLGLTAEIDKFFVAQSQRRSGVGTDLLMVAEAEFRRRGLSRG